MNGDGPQGRSTEDRHSDALNVDTNVTPMSGATPPEQLIARAIAVASPWGEVEARSGNVVRVVSERVAASTCATCRETFTSTGAAASHARSARHVVNVEYRTLFAYVPVERVLGDGV